MELSVIIPTCGRTERLEACCAALAKQDLADDRFEVLVGIDGPDQGEAAAAVRALPRARVWAFPKAGPGVVRNSLLAHCRGEYTLLLNDDVIPDPDCLRLHLEAHQSLRGRAAMVLGAAPWRVHAPDRLFDRLIRESSMVFFYNRMTGEAAQNPYHDWGFRHAWTLNLSTPTAAARVGFNPALGAPCYEDLEWAWRVQRQFAAPVLYRPQAKVVHDHRYEPEGYLARERRMGAEAWRLARVNAPCRGEIFGRNIASEAELWYSGEYVRREESLARNLQQSFAALAHVPADAIAAADCRCGRKKAEPAAVLMEVVYQQHLPLKRWLWRQGLLDAARADGLRLAA